MARSAKVWAAVGASAIAVVAGLAVLVPAVASGMPPTLVPASFVAAPHAVPPGAPDDHGGGKAWGHHKDDPGFPGGKGKGKDGADDDADQPGSGGKAWGHHKDDPGFPGRNGQGHNGDDETDG
jgi:hypothetical protein